MFVFCQGQDCVARTVKAVAGQRPARAAALPALAPKPGEAPEAGRVLLQVPFEYDRYDLSKAGAEALAESLGRLSKAPSLKIVGLADSFNRDAYNLKLAHRRAETVKAFLEEGFKGLQRAPSLSTDARIVRMAKDGSHPTGEAFKGRRVDLSVLIVEER